MLKSRSVRAAAVALGATALLALAACSPPVAPPVERTQQPLPAACPSGGGPVTPPATVGVGPRLTVLVPPANYQPGVKYPLLVSFHPFLLDQTSWENYSLLGHNASARGYWTLIPRGSDPGPRWSAAGGPDYGVDDVGYIDDLIVNTASTVCVDRDRIFAAGFSAGAAMSVGLSCELPWRFRAVVASGGSNLTSVCPGVGPTDALIIHGTADGFAPLDGNTSAPVPPKGITVDSVVANFAVRNGCGATPTPVVKTPTVTRQVYSCSGQRLEYWPVQGMGHTWASAAFPLDLVTGPTDTTFSATKEALDFFDAS